MHNGDAMWVLKAALVGVLLWAVTLPVPLWFITRDTDQVLDLWLFVAFAVWSGARLRRGEGVPDIGDFFPW